MSLLLSFFFKNRFHSTAQAFTATPLALQLSALICCPTNGFISVSIDTKKLLKLDSDRKLRKMFPSFTCSQSKVKTIKKPIFKLISVVGASPFVRLNMVNTECGQMKCKKKFPIALVTEWRADANLRQHIRLANCPKFVSGPWSLRMNINDTICRP